MKNNKLVRNLAAVSLIEIMMIFTIIGVVTAACAGLSKPKVEYMKKIRLYSSLVALEQAAKTIVNEGHLDFTTDVNTCRSRNYTTNICSNYNGQFPNLSNQLPKVSHRAASSDGAVDPGLSITKYNTLSDSEKFQFKYLQNGLCQRLASALKVQDAGINCSNNTSASGLIDDSSTYQQSFYGILPQLYLSNSQVVYIGKNAYTDFRDSSGSTTRKVINIVPSDRNSEWHIRNNSPFSYITQDSFLKNPNEMRLFGVKFNCNYYPNDIFYKYMEQMYLKNKDYFIIYVDTDCKKASASDKSCGPDRLNEDVFAFRMYRDGMVLPDYQSGFPRDLLTAKVMRIQNNGRYQVDANYAKIPLVHARCYANLAGSYAFGYANDHMGICTDGGVTRMPLNDCFTELGDTKCKAVINKPSFVMR